MRRRVPGKAFFPKLVEIIPPVFFAILTEFEKIFPTKDSGRMHVVERQPHRVIADRMHLKDLHRFFAADGAPLARRMALDLGARAAYAQIFGGEIKTLAAVESDGQRLAILVQPQFRRPGIVHGHLLFMANLYFMATSIERDMAVLDDLFPFQIFVLGESCAFGKGGAAWRQ